MFVSPRIGNSFIETIILRFWWGGAAPVPIQNEKTRAQNIMCMKFVKNYRRSFFVLMLKLTKRRIGSQTNALRGL